jgi:hypothetical protein
MKKENRKNQAEQKPKLRRASSIEVEPIFF